MNNHINTHGFVKVATSSPKLSVADCDFNASEIIKIIKKSAENKIKIIVFPELSITGYTCGDLFLQQTLQNSAEEALERIITETKNLDIISILGIPVKHNGILFNAATIIGNGLIYGIVVKTFLPEYKEFYEKRWFSSSNCLKNIKTIDFSEKFMSVPIGARLIFQLNKYNCKFGVEICEDLWSPISPSSFLSLCGADMIFNLSASNETIHKHEYRRELIRQQSVKSIAGYIYSSSSIYESSTDLAYSGACFIVEDGDILSENKNLYSLNSEVIYSDIDIQKIRQSRISNKSFAYSLDYYNSSIMPFEIIKIGNALPKVGFNAKATNEKPYNLDRKIPKSYFISEDKNKRNEESQTVVEIQKAALSKRLMHTLAKNTVIGVSGGLDSTLALLSLVQTYDKLGLDKKMINAISMPGFGTSDKTQNNAYKLCMELEVNFIEIPIKDAVLQHFKDIGQDPNRHDYTYENSQARERTQILMDYANMVNGLVIGTGDLSELALGWCTYNGDHMSMYSLNSGVPKTLVKAIVEWYATIFYAGKPISDILLDILQTPISPELLPISDDGGITQKTEDVVGPYELHDFFIYNLLKYGFTPSKIYFLAQHAFKDIFSPNEILKWLKVFYRRFFSQQFKRSCLPDGPKVCSISLSPRGDWKMPSDASVNIWLNEINKLN